MFFSVLTILAILFSPVIAIQVSVYLNERKEKKDRRLLIFRTLMATRASYLSYDHVRALNSIDVEFYGNDRESKAVVEAWKVYLNHLNDRNFAHASMEAWDSKAKDLLVDLLARMAICLRYEFDKASISKTSYTPDGYAQMEVDQLAIRKGLVELLLGKHPMLVRIVSGEPEEKQKQLMQMFEDYLQGKNPIKVVVLEKEGNHQQID